MRNKLRKLIFLKVFKNSIKPILVLAFFIFLLSLSGTQLIPDTSAYPFTEADEYKVLDDPRHAIEGDFDPGNVR